MKYKEKNVLCQIFQFEPVENSSQNIRS